MKEPLLKKEVLLDEVLLDDKVKQIILKYYNVEYNIKTNDGYNGFKMYLSEIIDLLNPDKTSKHLQIDVLNNNNLANYCSCTVYINRNKYIKKEEQTYSIPFNNHATFALDELHGNCSSVSLHHFNSLTILPPYGALFDNIKKEELFIKYIIQYLNTVIKYSNVFFTISVESSKALSNYCENNCEEVYKFKNRRNQHEIKYYCQLLNT